MAGAVPDEIARQIVRFAPPPGPWRRVHLPAESPKSGIRGGYRLHFGGRKSMFRWLSFRGHHESWPDAVGFSLTTPLYRLPPCDQPPTRRLAA